MPVGGVYILRPSILPGPVSSRIGGLSHLRTGILPIGQMEKPSKLTPAPGHKAFIDSVSCCADYGRRLAIPRTVGQQRQGGTTARSVQNLSSFNQSLLFISPERAIRPIAFLSSNACPRHPGQPAHPVLHPAAAVLLPPLIKRGASWPAGIRCAAAESRPRWTGSATRRPAAR
jgi:hypothetical protein